MLKTKFKNNLLLSSMIIMGGSLISFGTVHAQTPSDDAQAFEDEIIVTGFRKSLQEATDIKRESTSFVDAITAEDVGKFPDENVAESLQRITGVQITRLRGEGSNVNIRGLPSNFVQVRLNNVDLPNASSAANLQDTSRSFDFTALPSEFVRTLEVHKTPSASLDEGGLAGTVIVKTPKAFDFGERVANISVQGSNESNTNKISPKVTGFYANTFADDTFGISIGATYSERDINVQQYRSFGFVELNEAQGFLSSPEAQFGAFVGDGSDAALNAATCDGSAASQALCTGQDFNGNGVLDDDVVARIQNRESFDFIDETRDRYSGILSLQYRPNDDFEIYGDAYYSKLEIESALQESLGFVQFSLGPFFPDESEETVLLDGTSAFTTTRIDNVDLRHGNRIAVRDVETYSLTGGVKFNVADWNADLKLTVANSEQLTDNLNLVTRTFFDFLDEIPVGEENTETDTAQLTFLNGTESIFTDPSQSELIGINGTFQQPSEDDLTDIRLDLDRDVDWGFIRKIRTGAKYTDRSIFGGATSIGVPLSGLIGLVGEQGPATNLEARVGFTGIADTQSAVNFLLPVGPENGGFLDGQFPAERFIGDTEFLNNFTPEELIAAAGGLDSNLTQTEDVTEEILAAYVQADLESDDGRFSGNVGVRIVETDQTSRGSSADLNTIRFVTNGNETFVDPLDDVTVSRSYTEILPSINTRFEITEDLVLRAGASRTLTRPPLTAISTSTGVNFAGQQITGGNPELDPFISNNFDLSLEYYFGTSNLLSVSYFKKDLLSVIRTGTDTVSLPVSQIGANEEVTSVVNQNFTDVSPTNGSGVEINGFEVGYQQTFDQFEGILGNTGIIANYTYVDNSDVQALPAASEHNFNVGGFYEDDRLGVQLSYTWRDAFINEIAAFGNTNTEIQAFGTLDGSINYRVHDLLTLFVEGNNLTDEREVETFVNGTPRSLIDAGRRLTFGARASF